MNQQPRRLRSTAVSLGIVGALALSLSACGSTSASATRRCVDDTTLRPFDNAYQVVDDPNCLTSAAPATSGSFGTTPRYRHYYGGVLTAGYVSGGSFTVPAAVRSSSSSSRRWYNPTSWRSSSSGSSSTSSASSASSSSKSSGVTTGGFGSSSSSKGGSSSS